MVTEKRISRARYDEFLSNFARGEYAAKRIGQAFISFASELDVSDRDLFYSHDPTECWARILDYVDIRTD